MSKAYAPHVALIREALTAIESYQPESLAALQASPMARDAILMRLQQVGEIMSSIRSLDEERFLATGYESWHRVIGLRNVIAHGYHRVRIDQIWQILTEELPKIPGFPAHH